MKGQPISMQHNYASIYVQSDEIYTFLWWHAFRDSQYQNNL